MNITSSSISAGVQWTRRRSAALAALLAFASAADLGWGQVQFSPPNHTPAGEQPGAVASGDFDEDGHLDIVVADFGFGNGVSVAVLFGDGSGGFPSRSDVAVDLAPVDLCCADIDGDGHLDVAVACFGRFGGAAGSVRVLFGDGAGGFPLIEVIDAVSHPTAVLPADLDGDGLLDPAVANWGSGAVDAYLALGGRAFAFASTTPIGGPLSGLASADVDEDGATDVVAANGASAVVLIGTGDGSFVPSMAIAAGPNPFRLAATDLDADGHADVIVGNAGAVPGPVSILVGDGTGAFALARHFAAGVEPTSPVVSDLDEDGALDIAVRTTTGVAVLLGDGAGALSEPTEFPAGDTPAHPHARDMDGDGHLDLVVSNNYSGDVSFLRNVTFVALDCRRGNVNAAAGPTADVLLVNGSPGDARERSTDLDRSDPLEIRVEVPPSRDGRRAPFVVYAWVGEPDASTVRTQPASLGECCMPTPLNLTGGLFEQPQPREIWRNIAHHPELGTPTRSSVPAPTVILNLRNGVGVSGAFYFQGFILDSAAPNGIAATTNGIVVRLR